MSTLKHTPTINFPRNAVALRCWQCEKQVNIGEGWLTSSFPRECYHPACYPVMVNESGGTFPGGRTPLPPDVLALRVGAAIAKATGESSHV